MNGHIFLAYNTPEPREVARPSCRRIPFARRAVPTARMNAILLYNVKQFLLGARSYALPLHRARPSIWQSVPKPSHFPLGAIAPIARGFAEDADMLAFFVVKSRTGSPAAFESL